MEIERKYLVAKLPDQLETYPCRLLEQGYLNTNPVVRIRRDNEKYELTYKSAGLMSRQEYNLPLDRESYHHLLGKIDGRLIKKKRYVIPGNDDAIRAVKLIVSKMADAVIEANQGAAEAEEAVEE